MLKLINTILLTAIPCLWACLSDVSGACLVSVFASFTVGCVYSASDHFGQNQRNLVLLVHLIGLIVTTLVHCL